MSAARSTRCLDLHLIAPCLIGVFVAASALAAQSGASGPESEGVTFTKDVAPIFQRSCQVCHRPGQMAPMSLLSYEEVRPWARSIKQRAARREMPPWHIDRTVGIKDYVNDRSLTDEEITTIVRWVDSGAPRGNPSDLPPAVTFAADDEWYIGTPDLIVTMEQEIVVAAEGPDTFFNVFAKSGLTEGTTSTRSRSSRRTSPATTGLPASQVSRCQAKPGSRKRR